MNTALMIGALAGLAGTFGLGAVLHSRQRAKLRDLERQVRGLVGQPRGDRCVNIEGGGEYAHLAGAINAIIAEADGKATELEALSSKMDRLNRDLYEMANSDPLTGIANRRRFFEDLTQQLAQAGRYQHNLCVAVFDVDEFKQINDEYGFMAGDKVLMDLAEVSRAALRDSDMVARLGNEEFVLVMPGTPHGGAVALCERLRRDFEMRTLEYDGKDVQYRCSFGVTGYLPETDTADTLLGRGYSTLRLAKESGKNRVIAN